MSDELFMECPRCHKKPYVWYDYGFMHAKCDCHRSIGIGDTHFETYTDVLAEWIDYVADFYYADNHSISQSSMSTQTTNSLEELRAQRLKELEDDF